MWVVEAVIDSYQMLLGTESVVFLHESMLVLRESMVDLFVVVLFEYMVVAPRHAFPPLDSTN